jgi:hypothetical protein
VSKRSIRSLAVIAGAALALGSMAPAMASRIDSNDNPSTQDIPAACVPQIFPVDAHLVDDNLLVLTVNDDGDPTTDSPTLTVLNPPAAMIGDAVNVATYVTFELAKPVGCLAGVVLACLPNVQNLFPVDVHIAPGDPSLIVVTLSDDTPPAGLAPQLRALNSAPPSLISADPTFVPFLLASLGVPATCPLPIRSLPVECLFAGTDIFPLDVHLVDEALAEVTLSDDDVSPDPTLSLLDSNPPSLINGLDDVLFHLLGTGPVGCIADQIGGSSLAPLSVLSPVTDIAGSVLDPVTNVVGLTSGLAGAGLIGNGSLTAILSPAGITAVLKAQLAVIL